MSTVFNKQQRSTFDTVLCVKIKKHISKKNPKVALVSHLVKCNHECYFNEVLDWIWQKGRGFLTFHLFLHSAVVSFSLQVLSVKNSSRSSRVSLRGEEQHLSDTIDMNGSLWVNWVLWNWPTMLQHKLYKTSADKNIHYYYLLKIIRDWIYTVIFKALKVLYIEPIIHSQHM